MNLFKHFPKVFIIANLNLFSCITYAQIEAVANELDFRVISLIGDTVPLTLLVYLSTDNLQCTQDAFPNRDPTQEQTLKLTTKVGIFKQEKDSLFCLYAKQGNLVKFSGPFKASEKCSQVEAPASFIYTFSEGTIFPGGVITHPSIDLTANVNCKP